MIDEKIELDIEEEGSSSLYILISLPAPQKHTFSILTMKASLR